MKNIKLTKPAECHVEAVRKLYFDAFPPEERRPWESLVSPAAYAAGPVLRTLTSDNDFFGFVSYWNFGSFIYIEHLAVDSSLRGGGIGAKALALLSEATALPIVLEVEHPSPDNPMAERRIGFYRRNGLDILPFDYIQPPYAPGLPEVPLLLMSTDSSIDPAVVSATLRREVYGCDE